MISSAFDLGEQINSRTLDYKIVPDIWSKCSTNIDISFQKWKSIKYLNDEGNSLNSMVNNIPTDKGGLYLFYAKCPIISGITDYPFYIGRAIFTDNQNLRKRVKEYFSKYCKDNERPKIYKMFKYWQNELYLAYLELDDNSIIENLERDLINSLLLPMNEQIPDQDISKAVKAFQ
jgi:hypothetical protein